MSYVLAAVYVSVSAGGLIPTILAQQNVSSVVRAGLGNYQINFTNPLPTNNYGVLAGGRLPDTTTDGVPNVQPSRNASVGNAYSTTALNICCQMTGASSTLTQDPTTFFVLVIDPAQAGLSSDLVAGVTFGVLNSTATVQAILNQFNVPIITKSAIGIWKLNFANPLVSADYSAFFGSRFSDFTNESAPFVSNNRNTTGSNNLHTTTQYSLIAAEDNFTPGVFDTIKSGGLFRFADSTSVGTLASVRFTVSGGACTIIKQNNVSAVAYQGTGLYGLTFNTPLSTPTYGVLGSVKFPDSAGSNQAGVVGANRNSSAGRNRYTVNNLDVVSMLTQANVSEADAVDLWIIDPTVIGPFVQPDTIISQVSI